MENFTLRSGNSTSYKMMGSSPLTWPNWLGRALGGKARDQATGGDNTPEVEANDEALVNSAKTTVDSKNVLTSSKAVTPESNAARIKKLEASLGEGTQAAGGVGSMVADASSQQKEEKEQQSTGAIAESLWGV